MVVGKSPAAHVGPEKEQAEQAGRAAEVITQQRPGRRRAEEVRRRFNPFEGIGSFLSGRFAVQGSPSLSNSFSRVLFHTVPS